MKIAIIIILVLISIFLIWQIIRHFITIKSIKNAFMTGNVAVYGPKGYGKDILFEDIISVRKSSYFANLDYGEDYNHIEPKELELTPNDYNNFIQGNVIPVKKNDKLEGHDVYFSDGGVIFPSQADSQLHKYYPSLPISYALSRHLWNNGIHFNTQRLERVWKALREQADYYIRLRKKCLKLPFFIILFTTEYSKYESAIHNLDPLGSRLFNKYSKAEKDKFRANNGIIKNGLIIVPKFRLKYDSRAFHKIIFGVEAPKGDDTLWIKLKKKLSKKKSNDLEKISQVQEKKSSQKEN